MRKYSSKSSDSRKSARKTEANQKNALKSTGPKTANGKARSCQNALKHGFYATAVLLPGEDPLALEALREHLWDSLCPQNALEALYVREIVDTTWRLQRLGLAEGEIFVRQSTSGQGKQCGVGFAFVNDATDANAFSKFGVYEATLTRRLHKAMQQLRLLREKGWRELSAGDAPVTQGDIDSNPVDASTPASVVATQNTTGSPSDPSGMLSANPPVHPPADGAAEGKAPNSHDTRDSLTGAEHE